MNRTILFFTIFLVSLQISAQVSENRLALVIGNAAYKYGAELRNPVNDVNLMARTLKDLGFNVIKLTNASKKQMENAILNFWRNLDNYQVVLFYYAGHGVQINGTNYIIPVDAQLEDRLSVEIEAIDVNKVVGKFEYYPDNINIVILDACRNNPFRTWMRGGMRGFAAMSAPSGTLIAFATSPGSTAADGTGFNGLYTEKLSQQMKINQRIEDVFINTRVAVQKASHGNQIPQEWSQLTGKFNLTPETAEVFKKPEIGNITTSETYGNIVLITEISGDLFLDGERLVQVSSNTKIPITKVPTGNHQLEIIGDNVHWTENITVYKDQPANIIAKSNKPQNDYESDQSGTFVDKRDNQLYKWIKIGNQIWMAENLKFDAGTGVWIYNNNHFNTTIYGYLYNWEIAQNVCPAGWHLPSKREWDGLINFLGGSDDAGGKMKVIGTNYWAVPNVGGSNQSDFSALPSGRRNASNHFKEMGKYAYFWSSDQNTYEFKGSVTLSNGLYLSLSYNNEKIIKKYGNKDYGLSVRCIRDY